MDDFKIDITEKITVVKLDIIVATHRDAKPFWDDFGSNLLFDKKKIIIDLSACNYVDSTFIGMIIKIFRKVNEQGGKLKVVFPQRESVEQFWALGITKVISCFDSLQDAIDSFRHQLPIRNINFNDEYTLYLSLNKA
ncbi:MAG: STAS domain-containing protein [Ignavibacteriaceae bacterium]